MAIIMIFIILPVDRNYEHNMEHKMVIDHKIRHFMAILFPTVLPGEAEFFNAYLIMNIIAATYNLCC